MMILKLESSASSSVATSLEVSASAPTSHISFPKRQFSKSKSVVHWIQASWFHAHQSFMELHHYIIMRSQMVIVTFALYVCAMASREKMSSGNPDTAFVAKQL